MSAGTGERHCHQIRDRRGHAHRDLPVQLGVVQVRFSAQLLYLAQHDRRARNDPAAGTRHDHSMPVATEELHTEFLLEQADLATECWLRNAQATGRLVEAPELGDVNQRAQVSEVHDNP